MIDSKPPNPLSRFTVAVLTVPRQAGYIHQTLASLFSAGREVHDAGPIHVVVDSDDTRYLAEYSRRDSIRLHYMEAQETADQGRRGLCARLCYGFYRCLGLPVDRGLIVLEDDVIVRNGFLNCLLEAVDEMENVAGLRRYVLSLHSKHNLTAMRPYHRGRFYISSPAQRFYGTQGMYYPASMIAEVRGYLHQHGVAKYRRPGDLLIGEIVQSQQNLYNTVWDLVEHIGSVSTGLGKGRAFVSSTFNEPWRPFDRSAAPGPPKRRVARA